LTLLEQWELVYTDFLSEYGIRLLRDPCTYSEFKAGLIGLLSCDSRLHRWLEDQEDDSKE
jgi:hypothetical protein